MTSGANPVVPYTPIVTPEQHAEYIAYHMQFTEPFDFAYAPRQKYLLPEHMAGHECPYCGSDNLEAIEDGQFTDALTWELRMACMDCQGAWSETYYRHHLVTLTNGGDYTDDECLDTAEYRRHVAYTMLLDACQRAYDELAGVLAGRVSYGGIKEVIDALSGALAYGENYGDDIPL